MNAELALLAAIGLTLAAYVVTGGADFGGGVWDLLASGPRADRQRKLIEKAIAPIWEANHIWMIVAVVLLFTGFPNAFAAVALAMHIPIAAALVGIVLRGAAFTFRAYGLQPTPARARWGRVFAWSSLVTPVCLGAVVGGLSSGQVELIGHRVTSGFFAGWASPFAILVGLFSLVLFALLGAVYLTNDADDLQLADDFRRRALACELVAGGIAGLTVWRAAVESPLFFDGLIHAPWSVPVQLATATSALVATGALCRRRYAVARIAVVCQVGLVIIGWWLAMDGHLILPAMKLSEGGAVGTVVKPVLWTLAIGGALLGPALWYLFRVFKSER